MPRKPPVNPDADDIADEAKHGYATGTKCCWQEMQYRLAELVGSGLLDSRGIDEPARESHRHLGTTIITAPSLGTTSIMTNGPTTRLTTPTATVDGDDTRSTN